MLTMALRRRSDFHEISIVRKASSHLIKEIHSRFHDQAGRCTTNRGIIFHTIVLADESLLQLELCSQGPPSSHISCRYVACHNTSYPDLSCAVYPQKSASEHQQCGIAFIGICLNSCHMYNAMYHSGDDGYPWKQRIYYRCQHLSEIRLHRKMSPGHQPPAPVLSGSCPVLDVCTYTPA